MITAVARALRRRPVETFAGPAPWKVVSAAVAGTSHVRLGIPCQDAAGILQLPNGYLIVALADGAGSARLSEQGAQLAVEKALAALESRVGLWPAGTTGDWEGALRAAFQRARLALRRRARRLNEPPRELAATLTCLIAGEEILAVGQIGDGVVVWKDSQGRLYQATRAQKGEFANETNFLTQDGALWRVEYYCAAQPASAFAVTSDGLLRLGLKLPAGDPFSPFFEPLFAFTSAAPAPEAATVQLEDFLASERVCARTEDDKSLVIAVRR
ncbi:MAG TPA: PP2C family serine/threonine-protein phosphatase [Anaerolineaceae bacterium]|nr:PP2C family serine/threonine-protein phosphatase [Anaerolineaceae bacterium]